MILTKLTEQLYDIMDGHVPKELRDKGQWIVSNAAHDAAHIRRVVSLAGQFAKCEGADPTIVILIALLHDLDDYKLVGIGKAGELSNAKYLMTVNEVEPELQETVLAGIRTIGYNKRLEGIIPETLEAKVVADADMCDVLGAVGILRLNEYADAAGKPFFDVNDWPRELTLEEYRKAKSYGVRHIFEKVLQLKDHMLTESGKQECEHREKLVIDFLYHLFEEEEAYVWMQYLKEFLDAR